MKIKSFGRRKSESRPREAPVQHADTRWFEASDVKQVLLLMVLAPVCLLPARFWLTVCRWLGRLYVSLRHPYVAGVATCVPKDLLDRLGGQPGLYAQVNAFTFEQWLIAMRHHLPGGWKPRVRLTGTQHIDQALKQEHGAVLWVSLFSAYSLVSKAALHQAGYAPYHLSRPEHSISASRLGMRFLNPLVTRAEDRYLRARLLLPVESGGIGLGALRELRGRLMENSVVTITAVPGGQRLMSVPFLNAGLRLPTGPANLALAASAPLLPVFTLQTAADEFEVRVEAPLPLAYSGDKQAAIGRAVSAYAELLSDYVQKYPDQWVGPLTEGCIDEGLVKPTD